MLLIEGLHQMSRKLTPSDSDAPPSLSNLGTTFFFLTPNLCWFVKNLQKSPPIVTDTFLHNRIHSSNYHIRNCPSTNACLIDVVRDQSKKTGKLTSHLNWVFLGETARSCDCKGDSTGECVSPATIERDDFCQQSKLMKSLGHIGL